jgi:hypothetical protein
MLLLLLRMAFWYYAPNLNWKDRARFLFGGAFIDQNNQTRHTVGPPFTRLAVTGLRSRQVYYAAERHGEVRA